MRRINIACGFLVATGMLSLWAPMQMPCFDSWFEALYAHHTQSLSFAEIRRALRALSDTYVHKRQKLVGNPTLEGRGKQAAFALYYTPLHALMVEHIVRASMQSHTPKAFIDVGCGTGAASVGYVLATRQAGHTSWRCVGFDPNRWALDEMRRNCRLFHLTADIRRGTLELLPKLLRAMQQPAQILLGWVVNELPDPTRDALLKILLDAHKDGHHILITEPIARAVTPWWSSWQAAMEAEGGAGQEWVLRPRMPEKLQLFGTAAGLSSQIQKARSLILSPRSGV